MKNYTSYFGKLSAIALIVSLGACSQSARPGHPGWTADESSGCKVWNPNPKRNATVKWTGGCTNGVANGQGELTWHVGGNIHSKFISNFDNGRAHDENGKIIWYSNGKVEWKYSGAIRNYLPHGKGAYVWEMSCPTCLISYRGDIVSGKIEGYGSGKYKNGDSYEGLWKQGAPEGETAKNRSTAQERKYLANLAERVVIDAFTNLSKTYHGGSTVLRRIESRYPSGKVNVALVDYRWSRNMFQKNQEGWIRLTLKESGDLNCVAFHDYYPDSCYQPLPRYVEDNSLKKWGVQVDCENNRSIHIENYYSTSSGANAKGLDVLGNWLYKNRARTGSTDQVCMVNYGVRGKGGGWSYFPVNQ